ncbi:FAD-dependent monooxygenase [Actinomycetes bacterium KLBMP 9759]
MKVIVIGGGIGGLTLAQGLRGTGVEVEVHERDSAPGARGEGYRIHINPAGARSLQATLPPELFDAFVATSGRGGDFGFLTEQLAELVVIEESIMYPGRVAGPGEDHYAVDRATLRRLLLAGLDDVRFGAEFVRYEHTDDGRVAAIFADGLRAVGDLLVGADGASSRVRRQYLPQAAPVDAEVVGIAHKVYMDGDARIPARLRTGMNAIVANGPVGLFTSAYVPPRGALSTLEAAVGETTGVSDRPYVLCALLADPAVLPADVTSLDSDALRVAVDVLIARWHPDLRRLLAESDPAARSAMRFSASPALPAWTPTTVTLLGDAAHTMPPIGGLGGNAAMRDAVLLTQQVGAVRNGERQLLDAVATYEEGMREHGYAAVAEALAGRKQLISGNAIGTAAARAFFRLCRAVPSLRRRSFGDWEAPARPLSWEQRRASVTQLT